MAFFFYFYSYFNRTYCKQTVESLIRRRVLWCLIWVWTVCLCPTKSRLDLYGLRHTSKYQRLRHSKACFTSIVRQPYTCLRRQFFRFRAAVCTIDVKQALIARPNDRSINVKQAERLFLAMQWGWLLFVTVVFPDQTHLLFLTRGCKRFIANDKVKNHLFRRQSRQDF